MSAGAEQVPDRQTNHAAARRLLAHHPSAGFVIRPEIWSTLSPPVVEAATIHMVGLDDWWCHGIAVQLNNRAIEIIQHDGLKEVQQHYHERQAGCVVCDLALWEQADQESRRAAKRRLKCPLIFVGAGQSASAVAAAFRSGAFDVLIQPVPLAALCERVVLAAGQDQRRQAEAARTADARMRFETLSDREQEIMLLVAQGLSIKQVAARCGIGFQTVAKHRARVLKKMGVGNDVELALLLRNHLLAHVT